MRRVPEEYVRLMIEDSTVAEWIERFRVGYCNVSFRPVIVRIISELITEKRSLARALAEAERAIRQLEAELLRLRRNG